VTYDHNKDLVVELSRAINESLAISSHLPDLVDNFIRVRSQRLDLDKEVKALKTQEEGLSKVIIAKMREGDLKAIGASLGLIKLHETEEPTPENWDEIWKFVKENDAWELLHKRLTVTAVRERWADGIAVPGVGKTTVYKITPSKL
jgi:hypothetical protein